MSDTPETDALAFAAFDGQGGDEVVFANLARRFERERNKAEAGWLECRNFAQRIVDERDRYKSEVEVITRERDEALNKAHNYEQGYLTHAARADTLEKERDEARKENEEQAILLGKGSEREARFITERDHYKQALLEMFNSINEWNESMVKEPADDLIAAINHKINNVLNG